MKISLCGDVCPKGVNEFFLKKDVETLFHDVPTAFADSDRVVVNLECALTDRGTAIEKFGPNLKASPVCAEVLKGIGVTDCGLSNNHVFDWAVEGAEDTIKAVSDAGLGYTGFGKDYADSRKDLILEKDGVKAALITVCEHEYCYALEDRMGARPFHVYDTMDDIRKAKAENDYVIVMYHGGKEQSVYPSPRLRRLCQEMVKCGADVVLCQHSHCVGCHEEYEGAHILYGQGNFHFVEYYNSHPHWQNGLIVQLELTDKIGIEFVPVCVKGHGIELAKGEEKQAILDTLASQSEALKSDEWLKGWRAFCESMKGNYVNSIKNAYNDTSSQRDNDLFSHYLYCEAHRDVWEELFKLNWETRTEP